MVHVIKSFFSQIKPSTIVSALVVFVFVLSVSCNTNPAQGKVIVPLENDRLVKQLLLSQQGKPTLMVVLAEKTDKNTNENKKAYEVIERVCEQKKGYVNCAQINDKLENFKGAHEFFRFGKADISFVGVVMKAMRIGYLYKETQFVEITEQKLGKFIQGALSNEIEPLVDDSIPQTVHFEKTRVMSNVSFENTVQSNWYTFVQFYHPDDEGCKQYARRMDSIYEQLKQQDLIKDVQEEQIEDTDEQDQQKQQIKEENKVAFGAVNCHQYFQLCQDKLIKYYPTFRLYIRGLSVEFPKSEKVPSVLDITDFIKNKISLKIQQLSSIEQLKEESKPAVVFFGKQVIEQIRIFAQAYDKLPIYFIPREGDSYSMELHFAEEVFRYQGNLFVREVQGWIQQKIGPAISDILAQNPDSRIIKAIKDKAPIVTLIDVQESKSERFRSNFAHIANKLNFCGTYADVKHSSFKEFVDWMHLPIEDYHDRSRIVYTQIVTDKKYLYPQPLDIMSVESIERFLKQVRSNKYPDLGSPEDQEVREKRKKQLQTQQKMAQEQL